jgi:hypothetical protein
MSRCTTYNNFFSFTSPLTLCTWCLCSSSLRINTVRIGSEAEKSFVYYGSGGRCTKHPVGKLAEKLSTIEAHLIVMTELQSCDDLQEEPKGCLFWYPFAAPHKVQQAATVCELLDDVH